MLSFVCWQRYIGSAHRVRPDGAGRHGAEPGGEPRAARGAVRGRRPRRGVAGLRHHQGALDARPGHVVAATRRAPGVGRAAARRARSRRRPSPEQDPSRGTEDRRAAGRKGALRRQLQSRGRRRGTATPGSKVRFDFEANSTNTYHGPCFILKLVAVF